MVGRLERPFKEIEARTRLALVGNHQLFRGAISRSKPRYHTNILELKCDGKKPCRTCRCRDHPQMCVYDIEQSGTQRRTHRILEQRTFASKPNGGSTAERRASHPSSQPSQPLSDGPMSTYIYSSDNGSMAQGVRSVLGLQNTLNTYPFMDARTAEDRWKSWYRLYHSVQRT